ncbi:putative minichromosome loss protein 1 protein [Erysiphe necator]|uniref:Putative minichromosome loss protein 1 protein n=1 Tax=Uncinula necator TaxID=52586 RepID=A0A0B1NXT7_UNCNE|nr:putative minichromosome loss protein 1 protein [Erysiphe necator]
MTTVAQFRPRARPAHTRGLTHLSYTPDGTRLITVGSNNTTRVYKTGFDGEPTNIDDCPDQNTAVASTNDFFVVGSEDGSISRYSLETMLFEKYLTRCSLPIRDVDLSMDGVWCAVASDEIAVKIVKTDDIRSVKFLREHTKPVKHLSFDPAGKLIALSCTDGIVYIYSLSSDPPDLVRKIDGLIRNVETEDDICSKVAWCPDGRAFAAPTATRSIQVVSSGDWKNQKAFSNGHDGDILAISWSKNGAMLASASKDRKIVLWETRDQKVIATYPFASVIDLAWHPTRNLLSFTNMEGEVYIYNDFVPPEYSHLVDLSLQTSPFIHDPLAENQSKIQRLSKIHKDLPNRGVRLGSHDSLNDILDAGVMGQDDDDFISDDDGAGYALGLNENRKRPISDFDSLGGIVKHRIKSWEPQYHESFQPGSTPWRGGRKYLCLNLIGFVWTVDQDTHNTVTVEFYDHEFHRDFHFTDTFLYDKACLNENGTLFSCPAQEESPASIFYRPHETWTTRTDWRVKLPKDEEVISISLSDSYITVTTSTNYVRIYTLFGIPFRIYRQKSCPSVTCASWKDFILLLGNGPVDAYGHTKLLYTIQNVKQDEICQNEDVVALPNGVTLKSVFFSENGDPFIYDSNGILLTLLHWRTPSQAQWVPLLDTRLLPRLASGLKTESYFPVAVSNNKFHCIILKGTELYPYFPRPLLSEFDFQVPLISPSEIKDDNTKEDDDLKRLEHDFILKNIIISQQRDLIENAKTSREQKLTLQRIRLELDKTLLKMINHECRESEDRSMRALEIVTLFQDKTGKMIEAAMKIAERYDRTTLSDKIRDISQMMLADISED